MKTNLRKEHLDLITLSDVYLTVRGEKYYCKEVALELGESAVIVCNEYETYLFTSKDCKYIPERRYYALNTSAGHTAYDRDIRETEKILEAEIIKHYS
jgi:hypothetical protein